MSSPDALHPTGCGKSRSRWPGFAETCVGGGIPRLTTRTSRRQGSEHPEPISAHSRAPAHAGGASTVAVMEINASHRQAAAALAERTGDVTFAADPDLWRRRLHRISKGMLGRHRRVRPAPVTDAPWQDIASYERVGWRERIAIHEGDSVFSVQYRVCLHCRLGWVEAPYTAPSFRRAGLAAAGLAALRAEHAGLSWHTLGGHGRDSRQFWDRVGEPVPGRYRQRERCVHVAPD
jgi:hypothetical protein